MGNLYECRIEYEVVVEQLGTPQKVKAIQERRILPADSILSARETVARQIGEINNHVQGSLRFLNTHAISTRSL